MNFFAIPLNFQTQTQNFVVSILSLEKHHSNFQVVKSWERQKNFGMNGRE